MIVRRCWMLLAMAIVAVSLLADSPRPLPPGMGQYILVLWDPGTPIPGDPHGRKMKPIPEPDIPAMGGQVVASKYNRRLIILPRGVAKQLARHKAVAYLQRVWMGEPLEEEEDFSTDLRSEPGTESDVDLTWGPHAYSYDGSGNITAIGPDSYTYDTAGRLIRATVKGTTEAYKYDAFGNLVEKSGSTTLPIPVDAGSNRIIGVTYDEVGNITAQAPSAYLYAGGGYTVPGVVSYSYDSLGMLTAYKRSWNAIGFQMIYDANDERVGHMIDVDTVRWTIRDFEGQVLREYVSGVWSGLTWEWTQDHIRGEGQLIAGEVQTLDHEGVVWGGKRHYHLDHLGSVRIVTDEQGRSLSEHDYYPYGVNQTKFLQEQPNVDSGHIDRMRFAGHMRDLYGNWDVENKEYLDYMHARYYDPNLGRFLSVDPTWESADLGKPQSWNRYAYVLNNPIGNTDPDGRVTVAQKPDELLEKAVGAISLAIATVVLDPGPDFGNGQLPKDPTERAKYLEQRAKEIQSALPEATQGRTTTATAAVRNADGTTQVVVASSENNLRPSQRAALRPGETIARGAGHAEQTIINAAAANGQKVEAVAASRPICPSCAAAIKKFGGEAVTVLKRIIPFVF